MKRCKACRQFFEPPASRPMQLVCCPECAFEWSKQSTGKKQAAKVVRAVEKEKKQSVERMPDLHKKAQAAFNRYIRLRDQHKPCVSCGKPLPAIGSVVGGAFDCGHFRGVGRASHLRYTEAGQCKYCNRQGAGAYDSFRQELIRRIGEARVLELEQDNASRKWLRDDLRQITEYFKKKCKELE